MRKKNILKKVLIEVSLTKKEITYLSSEAKKIIFLLKKEGLVAEIGGSLAKGTLSRKKNQDVDIFVTLSERELSSFEKKISKIGLPYKVLHGSRDYIQIKKEDIVFELIPVLKINKDKTAKNITDYSLEHVKYVKKKIKENPELSNEIVLAKSFCHAQECYGAESYIGGFSGYSLEVLIIHYGSFLKFLKKIRKETIIDSEKQFKNSREILRELNQSKLNSPIILIDPTYKYRNVCAGLTEESYNYFLKQVKEFLRNPSEDFFKKKSFNLDRLIETAKIKNLTIVELDMQTNKQEGDIAGTKMRKLFKFLIRELEKKEQKIFQNKFIYEGGKESIGYITLDEKKIIEIEGPNKRLSEALRNFKKARKKVYFKEDISYAKERVSIERILKNNKVIAESMGATFTFKRIV